MEAHRISTVFHEGKQLRYSEVCKIVPGTRDQFVRMSGRGRLLAVQHLFLLANPKLPGKGGARRRDFYAAVDRIEERGGILWELYTGRRSDDPRQRELMIRDAVEAMATGRHKRTSMDKRGRPPKTFPPEVLEKAKAVWESRKYKTWDEAAKHLPPGMNKWDAWEEFGPRGDD
jgi:hypothetical protein